MSGQASQSIERFSVKEKSEYDNSINTVLNTDDAVKAKTAFTASTARQILDNKTGRIVGSVEWVQKSGGNRAPNFNIDDSFSAVLEGRPEPGLNIASSQPAQDDLFGKVESINNQLDHSEVVQLDFEPEDVNSYEIHEGVPIEAYQADEPRNEPSVAGVDSRDLWPDIEDSNRGYEELGKDAIATGGDLVSVIDKSPEGSNQVGRTHGVYREAKEPEVASAVESYKKAYLNILEMRKEFSQKPDYVRRKEPEEWAYHKAKKHFGEFNLADVDAMERNTNDQKGVDVKLPDGNVRHISNQKQLFDKIVSFNKERGKFYDEKYIKTNVPEDYDRLTQTSVDLAKARKAVVADIGNKSTANKTIVGIERLAKSDFEEEHEIENIKSGLDNHLASDIEIGSILGESGKDRLSTHEIGSKLDADRGRWQVISFDSESNLSSILFTTDDQSEAMDALKGYEPNRDFQLHIYDATNGQRLVSRDEVKTGFAAQGRNIENNNDDTESIEKHTEKAFASLGDNEMDDTAEFSSASEPETDAENDKVENHGQHNWKSIKANQKKNAIDEPENDDLEDDQIFEPGPSYYSGYRGAPSGGTYQTSTLGAIRSSLASSVRNIVGRDRNSSKPSDAKGVSGNFDLEKESLETQFNRADADKWRVNQFDREMTIIGSEIKYSVDAINRLGNSEYAKLAKEIESSNSPSDDQVRDLSVLKESTSVKEAKHDIAAHINSVESRVSRMLKDENLPMEAKNELETCVKKWSKDVDTSVEALPNDDFKKDLLSKIRQLVDLIVDRLTLEKSTDPSPSTR